MQQNSLGYQNSNRSRSKDAPRDGLASLYHGRARVTGKIQFADLPPHRGLIVSLMFFEVSGPTSDPPMALFAKGSETMHRWQVFKQVDLCVDSYSFKDVPFQIDHSRGYFYLLVSAILVQLHNGTAVAQVEAFPFHQRPLPLIEDLPSVTLPIRWRETTLENVFQCCQ